MKYVIISQYPGPHAPWYEFHVDGAKTSANPEEALQFKDRSDALDWFMETYQCSLDGIELSTIITLKEASKLAEITQLAII